MNKPIGGLNIQPLKYKGYFAKVEFSSDDNRFHGRVEGISDLVTFESDSAAEIENEFHAAVDEYLNFCSEAGRKPCKAYYEL